MIGSDEFPTTILISFSTEVEIVRIIGTTLSPAFIKIKTELFPSEGAEDQLSPALAKIKYWFDNIVNRSVIFSGENGALSNFLLTETGGNRLENIYVMTPGEPTDDMLATLFQAKMTALANGALQFEACEVRSNNMLGIVFTVVGNPLDLLPSMKEWIGDKSYFDQPWWERNDASSIDIVAPDGADLSERPLWAFTLDPKPPSSPSEAPVIVQHNFRPKVIDGGKD